MNPNLLNALVKKELISAGTSIEAEYMAPGLDGCFREKVQGIFTVSKVVMEDTKKVNYLLSIRESDGAKLMIKANAVVSIDGMEPALLGKAFDILPDGKMKKVKLDEFGMPVRRGRKPKIPRHELAKQLKKESRRKKAAN